MVVGRARRIIVRPINQGPEKHERTTTEDEEPPVGAQPVAARAELIGQQNERSVGCTVARYATSRLTSPETAHEEVTLHAFEFSCCVPGHSVKAVSVGERADVDLRTF